MHPELAFGAFLAAALVLVPFPWHWRARNTTTLSMLAWLFVSNLEYAINSIIWAGRTDNVVPVWCDIVTKINIGATAALPACCLSLALQLWRVSSTSQTTNKKMVLMVDLSLCWVYPAIAMALHYVVQGHRFDIFEDIGCRQTTYFSVPTILLVYVPGAVVMILTFTFSALASRAFYLRRRTFTTFLQNKNSSFTARRYLRLMIITLILATWEALVMVIVYAITFVGSPLEPYISWANVHSGFSRVDQLPAAELPPAILVSTYVAWWTIPISGLLFFSTFSFGEDAAKEYGPLLHWIARPFTCKSRKSRVPRETATSSSSQAHLVSLPYRKDESVIDIRADFADTSSQSDSWDEVKINPRASYEQKTDASTLV
ncbi:putative fungal pheromone GPCR, STE3-type [Mycena polygramma]|nr:putative fungal pheromone GPCR, STE3-type [Mycena polygramma]